MYHGGNRITSIIVLYASALQIPATRHSCRGPPQFVSGTKHQVDTRSGPLQFPGFAIEALRGRVDSVPRRVAFCC